MNIFHPQVLRHIAAGHLCAFLFLNILLSQGLDSSIIISDFQYPDIHGIPIILDETGENTYYLNEWNPEFISDGKINQVMLDGALGIPLGSYFFPKLLPKSSHVQPSVPIVSEDDIFDEDITIESTDPIAPAETIRSTPPPLEDPVKVKFIPYDKAPKPKIPIRPVYPEIAQKAGIEGTVFITFFIDVNGNVTEEHVTKGIPNTGLNEVALEAVKKSTWKPAQQRDKKVGVWQTVPVKFELTADSVKKISNISQIYYRKGDYDFSDLGIGLQIESPDSGLFSFQGFKRSLPQLYQNGEDELQNYLLSFKRIMNNSNLGVSILYHYENVNLPVNIPNVNRNVESFHGGLNIDHSWDKFTIGVEQAYQFTYSNRWDKKVSYLTIWNRMNSTYQLGEDIKIHLQHNYKMHSTELDGEVIDVPSQVFSSLVEYGKQGYSIQAGFSAYKSLLIPIGSLNWICKNYYLSAKRNYEVVFTQTEDFLTKENSFSTDALILGYKDKKVLGELEIFHTQNEEKSNLGVKGKTIINLSWLDLKHTTAVYNVGSDNSSPQPLDMFSYTSLIFSPNVWRWKKARYQPFIGVESTFIQHSGRMGINPMNPAIIIDMETVNPFSSFLVNMEMGLLVNQFKISYRWVKFNMLGNTANNSINPDSYSILSIRHLEIVWQFWD